MNVLISKTERQVNIETNTGKKAFISGIDGNQIFSQKIVFLETGEWGVS